MPAEHEKPVIFSIEQAPRCTHEPIADYLRSCVRFIREEAACHGNDCAPDADAVIRILTSHEFNYQARGRVAHLLPQARQRIAVHMAQGLPIPLYLDFGGGYHASIMPDYADALNFDILAAELLLVYQVTRLQRKIQQVYRPGVAFHIMLDNGVAHYANDIAIADTLRYCQAFQAMLVQLQVDTFMRIVPQTSVSCYYKGIFSSADAISAQEHRNIERFLGRPCSVAEARDRLGKYRAAEAHWEAQLLHIIDAQGAIRLLQRATQEYFSFRSFPGGAARVQCGRIGFREQGAKLVPTLITMRTHALCRVVPTTLDLQSILAG